MKKFQIFSSVVFVMLYAELDLGQPFFHTNFPMYFHGQIALTRSHEISVCSSNILGSTYLRVLNLHSRAAEDFLLSN